MIAQGYNPDRVTEQDLGTGYRTVPRKYLKGEHDLDGVAEVWNGTKWTRDLSWCNDTDTHRTTLTNAQLGLRKKRDWIAPGDTSLTEAIDELKRIQSDVLKNVGIPLNVVAELYESSSTPAAPVWRNITEAEQEILRAAAARNAAFNWTRFRYYGMDNPNCDFSDSLSAYRTTLTPDEIQAYAFRPITADELEILRANRERVDLTKFKHLGSRGAGYFFCPPEHYSTSMTPEEIADLKWRDLSEAERTALRGLRNTPRSQFSNLHFRHDGIKPWYHGTCIFADDPALRYQTDLTEAEVAALVKPWRQLTPDETKALRGVKGIPVEYLNYGSWEKTETAQVLAFLDEPEMYRTSLTPDEMAKWIAEHVPAKPVPTPTVWRPITEDERKKLEAADKSGFDWTKFQHHGRSFPGLDFKALTYTYTTTLTPAELAKLVEVWRPLSLAEVKIMRRAKGYDPSRFRCDFGSLKNHSFKAWDFAGTLATNYQTTYSEQEIADLL